jgi:hypothetical protein
MGANCMLANKFEGRVDGEFTFEAARPHPNHTPGRGHRE